MSGVFGFNRIKFRLYRWTSSSLSGSRHDTKGERRNKSYGGRSKKERGKFIGEVHLQSKRPSLEQVHKENDERKVSDLHDNVHIVKRKEHKFVKSSSHKLDFVKRSLHKLETINCTYTKADCLTNKVSELRLLIRNHKPIIFGITKVKLKNFRYDIEDAEIALDGYDMLGCNLHNKTGRGCAIYVKKKKQCTG